MGDRTRLCEVIPEEDCNEAGESESAVAKWQCRALRVAYGFGSNRRPHDSGCLGGGRGVARAGITTAVGGLARNC